ncbi:MAG: xanthine dehydrogenase family protein subunit M [Planctomycetes bacterium]|nr:xanthine dehydrogenase family protein subunit M [Planctomycetota bacterium]MCH9726211.1 xanthine dehydrogenase family protein subunit M [Planctomycetota bacterium]MCH9775716.1 xanthine dehydrogenase family protein subunit M [Planctomycetota bacterium]MCH9792063.1 xanthine dehydrogenase family protein subunit M [Planctomycetota bacterium]
MRDFDYEAPTSLADAVGLLTKSNGTARPLAGGTDLIDHVRTGRVSADLIVDLKKIPELMVLEVNDEGLRLGAAVPCYQIYEHPGILEHYSAISDSSNIIGGMQIQNRASVGGNLANAGAAADSTPALIALSATVVITGPSGTREIPVDEFCTGPGQNVLESGEIIVELRFPPRPAHSGSHYRRFIPRNEMDIAVVGVGASVVLDESGENFVSARIGLGAVAAKPFYAQEASEILAGQPVNDETIQKAGAAARAVIHPITDMRGTEEFRNHVTGVLTERVVKKAVERARG